MRRPREEKMNGSQSMKVMWVEEPLRSDLDHIAASRRM